MKNRYLFGLLGVCIISAVASRAQESVPVKQQTPDKPFIFSQLPERSICATAELQELFRNATSASIVIHLSGDKLLRGMITEKIERSPGITSINIKLSNYPGALFNLSSNTQPGQSPIIKGRIIHPQAGDVLVLSLENDQYLLQKRAQKFFMTE